MSKSPEQIFEVANRGSNNRLLQYEVDRLDYYVSKLNEEAAPLLDFVPVKLVTIIENCVRAAVQQIVDHGEPYTERGIEIISRWSSKNLVQSLRYSSNKRLTIGQLAAHGFSVSNLTDVMSILGQVHGVADLSASLAAQTTRWSEDKEKELKPVIVNHRMTFSCIERLFELRHIIVHEIASMPPFKRGEANEFVNHTRQFVEAIEWLTTERLYKFSPRTQSMMNSEAATKAYETSQELDGLRGGGSKDFEKFSTPVQELEYHWDRFADLTARRYAGYFNDGQTGSIAPMLYADMLERLLKWRIDNYASQLDWEPGGRAS